MGAAAEFTISTEPTGPEAPTATTTERPANVPEKFWNAEKGEVNTEALLSSYASLEGKLGTARSGSDEAAADDTAEADDTATEETSDDTEGDKARQIAEDAGLDIPALEAHWEEHGALPEETYTKLAAAGVDKTLVDEFVQYRIAQGTTIRNEMFAEVGGEEAVNKMIEWAGKNYTQEKADAANEAFNSKNRGKIELALRALKADYDKANGSRPKKLLTGDGNTTVKGDRYASLEEMLRDQAKPEYRKDPAFRQRVLEKLSRSEI